MQCFQVVQPLYADIRTNKSGDDPTFTPIEGAVIFTPNFSEIDSAPLDQMLLLEPITATFSVNMPAKQYTTVTDDTWASIVAAFGGYSLTVASLQAANPGVSTSNPITAGTVLTIPGGLDGALRSLNGAYGVELVDNQDLGLSGGMLTYRVDYLNVEYDGIDDRHINSLRFAAPGDGSAVDLNTVSRLPL